MNTCETCKWWLNSGTKFEGQCHRYPPTKAERNNGWWIKTRNTDGCGEHTPRESEASGRAGQGSGIFALNADTNESGAAVQTSGLATPSAGATAGPYIYMSDHFRAGRDSMREPTPAMIDAGGATLYDPPPTHHEPGQERDYADDARAVWDAMWKARD